VVVLFLLTIVGLGGALLVREATSKLAIPSGYTKSEPSRSEIWRDRQIISVEKVDAARNLNPFIVRYKNKPAFGAAPSYSKEGWIVTYETPVGIKRTETLSYDPTEYQSVR
jgi:hypothetical protein